MHCSKNGGYNLQNMLKATIQDISLEQFPRTFYWSCFSLLLVLFWFCFEQERQFHNKSNTRAEQEQNEYITNCVKNG